MHLYIHIPFCQKKCVYCAFTSISNGATLFSPYVTALKKELKTLPQQPLKTLFFGGGTPTALPQKRLVELVNFNKKYFGFTENAEISVESNPGTINLPYLLSLRQAGVNRLSIGVQSFHDNELRILGRIHTTDDAKKTCNDARQAGFTNISLDLMYGLPQQSVASWQASLQQAIALAPEHLSLYQLTPEEDTPLFAALQNRSLKLPTEQEILAMDKCTRSLTAAAGYSHYEISNFALPDRQCQHNLIYWRNESWYAAGAAAVSYITGNRAKRTSSPQEYIARITAGQTPVVESERLNHQAAFRETVIMGLRLYDGVEISRLQRRFGIEIHQYYGNKLEKLLDQRLLLEEEGKLRLSDKGRNLANPVMAILV